MRGVVDGAGRLSIGAEIRCGQDARTTLSTPWSG